MTTLFGAETFEKGCEIYAQFEEANNEEDDDLITELNNKCTFPNEQAIHAFINLNLAHKTFQK